MKNLKLFEDDESDDKIFYDALAREKQIRDDLQDRMSAEQRGINRGMHLALNNLIKSGMSEEEARKLLNFYQ